MKSCNSLRLVALIGAVAARASSDPKYSVTVIERTYIPAQAPLAPSIQGAVDVLAQVPRSSLIKAIAGVIADVSDTNAGIGWPNRVSLKAQSSAMEESTIFDAVTMPEMPLETYLSRLSTFTGLSSLGLVCSLVYLDRLTRSQDLFLTPERQHRAVCAAVLLAWQVVDGGRDAYQADPNGFAKVAGISLAELRRLELGFRAAVQQDLSLPGPEAFAYAQDLQSYIHQRQGR